MHDDDADDDALLAAAWERQEAECLCAGIPIIDHGAAPEEADHDQ